jgi:hypothetical protein
MDRLGMLRFCPMSLKAKALPLACTVESQLRTIGKETRSEPAAICYVCWTFSVATKVKMMKMSFVYFPSLILTRSFPLTSLSCGLAMIGANYIVNERGFTSDAIAMHKGERLNGRNIYDRALTCIAMCKVALKYFHEFCPGGKLPSGKSAEDMLLYVRQKMFVHLRGAKNNKSNSKKKEEADQQKVYTEEGMPDKWLFNGWFVFVLFGTPLGLANVSLSCLSEDGKDVPKVGRAEIRAKAAKTEMEQRRADDGSSGKRGVSMQDQLTMATLSQAEFREETKNVRELLALANSQEANTLSALKLTCQMLAEAGDDEREKRYLKKRKLDLLGRLEELDARKRRLEEESDRLREEAARKKTSGLVNPPEQVSISVDETTMTSLSHSGSSSKKKKMPKRSPELVVLMNESDDEDEDDDEMAKQQHCDQLAQSFDSNYASPPATTNNNKRKAPLGDVSTTATTTRECPVAAKLDATSRAVLNAFRAKQSTSNAPDYGMDYPY